MLSYDAIVVGAGYVGCAVADALTARGVRTALVDQGSVPGGASRANYGNVQVQDAELAYSLPLVTAGYRCFSGLEEELGRPVGYRRLGSLLLIENEAQWQLMASRIPLLRRAGIRAELVPAARLSELEPALDRTAVLGACYHPDEGQVSPFALMGAYLWRARQRGLSVHARTAVNGFDIRAGRVQGVMTDRERLGCGALVLTTGAWTPQLGGLLGRRWEIPHVHGQALVTEATDLRLHNHLSSAAFFESMHGGAGEVVREAVLAVAQTAEGHLLLGEAGEIVEHHGAHATRPGQASIAREVMRFLPSAASLRILRGWGAPVAFTADGRPFLGPVGGVAGLFLATAFKSTVVVTPLVGSLVAQLVCDGRSDMDLTPFSPDREVDHAA